MVPSHPSQKFLLLYDIGDCKYNVISVFYMVSVGDITSQTPWEKCFFCCFFSSVFLFPAEIKYSVELAKISHCVKWTRSDCSIIEKLV